MPIQRTPKSKNNVNKDVPASLNTTITYLKEDDKNCHICKRKDQDDWIGCDIGSCGNWFHRVCLDMDVCFYNKLVNNTDLLWLCPSCSPNSSTNSNGLSTDDLTALKKELTEIAAVNLKNLQLEMSNNSNWDLTTLKKDLADITEGNLKHFKNEMSSMIESGLKNVQEVVEDLKNEVNLHKNENNTKFSELNQTLTQNYADVNVQIIAIQKKFDDIAMIPDLDKVLPVINDINDINEKSVLFNEKLVRFDANLSSIEATVDKMERLSKLNNLVIDGVPQLKGENLSELMVIIANHLKIEFYKSDMSSIFRLANKNKTPSIVITFISKQIRDIFFSEYLRNNNIRLLDLGIRLGNANSKIFINEHLTFKYSNLLKEARDLKTQGLIQKTFSRNGIPIVVKNGGQAPIRILNNDDLQRLALSAKSSVKSKTIQQSCATTSSSFNSTSSHTSAAFNKLMPNFGNSAETDNTSNFGITSNQS